mmetsp:Transcript_37659/g.76637  ORF Transcript_37659/g.76637 Transcript_37659/m.76637 type:complete len:676 (+) Transcript_37659:82-2109(+)
MMPPENGVDSSTHQEPTRTPPRPLQDTCSVSAGVGASSAPTISVIPISASSTPGEAGLSNNDGGFSHHHHHNLPLVVSLYLEAKHSAELIFASKLTWLLIAGPLALAGSATGALPESTCFTLAGLALIPCAERLSFVTEQVAAHTNGTIGALLNASFGNAPELLISSAALRAGFYRVVQLAMLGSILCNLLFVFGISCFIGGLRWQVQDLRIVSGSVPIAILLLSTSGVALPAALKVSGQIADLDGDGDIARELIGLSRFNALVMMSAYLAYLMFQLGTHKEEYDDTEEEHERFMHHGGGDGQVGPAIGAWRKRKARRNIFCYSAYRRGRSGLFHAINTEEPTYGDDGNVDDVEMAQTSSSRMQQQTGELPFRNEYIPDDSTPVPQCLPTPTEVTLRSEHSARSYGEGGIGSTTIQRQSRSVVQSESGAHDGTSSLMLTPNSSRRKLRSSDSNVAMPAAQDDNEMHNKDAEYDVRHNDDDDDDDEEDLMTFRAGIVWLFVITLCISSLSDILVESIDGFAEKMHISEVFTSVIILPFFSNIAEQVSAVIFAYRNEMDLCVGVTVGSAAQIALMVLPGCVLVGWIIDRSMSMYVHGYETCCLLIGTLLASAVLLGGTTNWVTGFFFVVVYLMMACGFWFHELEELDVDAEKFWHSHNGTKAVATAAYDTEENESSF